ncbi:MAG: cell division protein FtsA [Alphaproteobacteria bacterium]|nr:cell division protein FtsA [Alphaproteobacteria bacterium]
MAKAGHNTLAAIDIGTAKICAMVALTRDGGLPPEVIGIGHAASEGLRGSSIIDMDAAESAIARAMQEAEDSAGCRVNSVLINISAGNITSERIDVSRSITGDEVTGADVAATLAGAEPKTPGERLLLHKLPLDYTLNDNLSVKEPRGMMARKLAATVHVATVERTVAASLLRAVRRCHLEVSSLVASPYASALSCLVDDEMQLGTTLVDMGAGSTTLAVFQGGHLLHLASIPLGGHHITKDIAYGLSTTLADAERFKVLHGSALANTLDDRDILDIPIVGEMDKTHTSHVPRSYLTRIIQPRVEETLEKLRATLDDAGLDKSAGRLVVLTGGASQLPGVRDAAAQILDKKTRLGKPQGFHGLPAEYQGAAFSTVTGLLRYARLPNHDVVRLPIATRSGEGKLSISKAIGWLRENF